MNSQTYNFTKFLNDTQTDRQNHLDWENHSLTQKLRNDLGKNELNRCMLSSSFATIHYDIQRGVMYSLK